MSGSNRREDSASCVYLLLAFTLLAAIEGCSSSPLESWANLGARCPPDAPALVVSQAALDSLPPDTRNDLNTEWAAAARRVPGGWGGYFFRNGRSTMYMLEPSLKEEALAALRLEGIYVGGDPVVLLGRWDFAQLYDWYRYLRPHLVAGVIETDVDESKNRLHYGVVDGGVRTAFEGTLAELGVPCHLVAISIQQIPVAATPPGPTQ